MFLSQDRTRHPSQPPATVEKKKCKSNPATCNLLFINKLQDGSESVNTQCAPTHATFRPFAIMKNSACPPRCQVDA